MATHTKINKFQVHTDHKNLQYLFNKANDFKTGKLFRWAVRLQDYHFRCIYVKRKDNTIADWISRESIAIQYPQNNVIQQFYDIGDNMIREQMANDGEGVDIHTMYLLHLLTDLLNKETMHGHYFLSDNDPFRYLQAYQSHVLSLKAMNLTKNNMNPTKITKDHDCDIKIQSQSSYDESMIPHNLDSNDKSKSIQNDFNPTDYNFNPTKIIDEFHSNLTLPLTTNVTMHQESVTKHKIGSYDKLKSTHQDFNDNKLESIYYNNITHNKSGSTHTNDFEGYNKHSNFNPTKLNDDNKCKINIKSQSRCNKSIIPYKYDSNDATHIIPTKINDESELNSLYPIEIKR